MARRSIPGRFAPAPGEDGRHPDDVRIDPVDARESLQQLLDLGYMQMLAAGGLPILADETRAADADNPRGYLEYEAAKRPDAGTGWLLDARGKAVKIVAQLLPALTARHRYRVIFAERPLNGSMFPIGVPALRSWARICA